jgi:hypothetical protein
VNATTATENTKLVPARPTISSRSRGETNTLQAYSEPIELFNSSVERAHIQARWEKLRALFMESTSDMTRKWKLIALRLNKRHLEVIGSIVVWLNKDYG